MPRQLKTFITNLGFFELAIAAPSMKAALEAWGMNHNAFQHGFAKQTDDDKIISATMAQPGVVLKRAVGTSDRFAQDASLPTSLPAITPPASKPISNKSKAKKPKRLSIAKSTAGGKAAILSFEKAKAERDKKKTEEAAEQAKELKARLAAVEKAEGALKVGSASLDREIEKLKAEGKQKSKQWDSKRRKLEAAIARAKQ